MVKTLTPACPYSPLPSMKNLKRIGHRPVALALCMTAAALCGLAGCGKKEGLATQVAAKVNDGEISVHQVNLVLQRQPDVPAEQAQAAGRAALDRLVQLELAVQKAHETKLDRDPQVVQAIDLARREILARTYIDRLAESVSRPSMQEIEQFYAAQPALFKDRKVYSVQQIVIATTDANQRDLQGKLESAGSGQAMVAELVNGGIAFTSSTATRPSEDWPLAVLDALKKLGPGQSLFLPQGNELRVLQLREATPAPRPLDEARSAIEQYLINQNKQKKVDAELAAMRAAATVSYLGKFAEAGPGTAAAVAPPAAAPVAAAASAPATSASSTTELDAQALSKGIRGLK